MKLGTLADALGLPLNGNPDRQLVRLAPLASAGADELSFIVSKRFVNELRHCNAGAVIAPSSLANEAPCDVLISDNPYASYARASWLLAPELVPAPGIHEMAIIEHGVEVGAAASIGAGAVIKAGARIGDGAIVEERCVIGERAIVGHGSRLFPGVSIYHDCVLGEQCRVQSGAVIGAEGFGFAFDRQWQPIHQTGRVVVGNRVHIGANTTIDRGALDDTVIEDGVILDNQIQIAHNVQIGENTAIAGCVGIAGSTVIGKHCQIGGASNIVGHLHIADDVVLNATSFVTQSISEPGRYSSGMPLQSSGQWRRTFAVLSRLDELLKRVRRLERER